jgi:hypothetical protein
MGRHITHNEVVCIRGLTYTLRSIQTKKPPKYSRKYLDMQEATAAHDFIANAACDRHGQGKKAKATAKPATSKITSFFAKKRSIDDLTSSSDSEYLDSE